MCFLNCFDWIAIAHYFPSDSILVDNARTLCLPCMTHCSFSRTAKSCVRGSKRNEIPCIVLTSRSVLRWCRCTPPNATYFFFRVRRPLSSKFEAFESCCGATFISLVYHRLVSHMLSIICLSFTWNLSGAYSSKIFCRRSVCRSGSANSMTVKKSRTNWLFLLPR